MQKTLGTALAGVVLGAVAVPLLIHLLRRRLDIRLEFPAARYLARAERENSRTLKLRNLLLMAIRILTLLAVAVAASQPVARWIFTNCPSPLGSSSMSASRKSPRKNPPH